MKNNDLIVTTSNFESLVASLHSNLKLGYGKCSKIELINSFYRAVLEHGKDASYIARLGAVDASEKENVLDLMHYLANASTPVREAVKTVVDDVVKPLDTGEEAVKIKRTRTKKELK